MEGLFFELLQLAVGRRECLSRVPSAEEWEELYLLCQKHALVGMGLAPLLSPLQGEDNSPMRACVETLPIDLAARWVHDAEAIRERNKEVSEACRQLCRQIRQDGFDCCVLKGQSNLENYRPPSVPLLRGKRDPLTPLRGNLRLDELRTPGDIDVWVAPKGKEKHPIRAVVEYGLRLNPQGRALYHHMDLPPVNGVEVELHWRPTWLSARPLPAALRFENAGVTECEQGFPVASWEFNVAFQLLHIYRHLFSEGIGLRQLMDYYMLLKTPHSSLRGSNWSFAREGGLPLKGASAAGRSFPAAVMWVLQEVFALPEEDMLCAPDEKEGRFLLSEIMQAGNFGQHDPRNYTTRSQGPLRWGWMKLKRNMRFLRSYPEEVLCEPLFRIYHLLWRKLRLWRWE